MSKRVLLVEDDPGMQAAIEGILELEGYTVTVARDGLDGLRRLEQEHRPELILLDLMMPRMDGYTFAAELARRGLRPTIPIVILTADGRARQKAERIGADGYLEKPFEVDDLLEQVSRFVGR